jgi:hypothetical protein
MSIQKKSFIFHLFNLFKKGEKRIVKKREKNKIIIIFNILYKSIIIEEINIIISIFFIKIL